MIPTSVTRTLPKRQDFLIISKDRSSILRLVIYPSIVSANQNEELTDLAKGLQPLLTVPENTPVAKATALPPRAAEQVMLVFDQQDFPSRDHVHRILQCSSFRRKLQAQRLLHNLKKINEVIEDIELLQQRLPSLSMISHLGSLISKTVSSASSSVQMMLLQLHSTSQTSTKKSLYKSTNTTRAAKRACDRPAEQTRTEPPVHATKKPVCCLERTMLFLHRPYRNRKRLHRQIERKASTEKDWEKSPAKTVWVIVWLVPIADHPCFLLIRPSCYDAPHIDF